MTRIILPLALALALSTIPLAVVAAEPRLAAEQVLRKGNGPEVESLDPHRVEGVQASHVLRDLFESLVTEAADGALIPGTAERWDISADGMTYTFYLRRDARWSNGDPFVAEDVVAGLRRSVDPATGSHYSKILSPIENADAVIEGKLPVERLGATALDPHTVEIRLKGPTPYFIGLLVHASAYPIHRASVERYGAQFAQPGKLVSNGAYQLTERVIQSHITLRRNPYYWNDASTVVEEVRYLNTEDVNSELKRYRAGELDWTSTVPTSQTEWIKANLPEHYHEHTYLGVYYYGLNTGRPPLDSKALRQALSLALDREIITRKVLGGGQKPADTWVPPGVIGHVPAQPEWMNWDRQQRLTEARRLYAEAGYSEERPARVEIRYNTSEDHKKVASVIAAMWKQWLGVETVLINEEWKVYLQNRRLKQKTQAFRAGWIGDYNDANTFMEILHSEHGLNDTGYANPEYDALLEQAGVEADLERRSDLMRQAEALLLQDLPVIPIYFYVTTKLVRPTVVGWQGNLMDHHATRYMRILEAPPAN